VLVDLDDGSGIPPLAGSTPFEDVVATDVAVLPEPSPDDLYVVCTGGTTGRPKAVMWRQADAFVAAMSGSEALTAGALAEAAVANVSGPSYAVPPLMHAAAQWTALAGIHNGAGAVVHDDSGPFDPATILATAERERVGLMSIVGDAYAGPIVEELRRATYDLSSLRILATGGAATGEQHKTAILELLPDVVIIDGYGASETGGMAFGARTARGGAEGFNPSAGATVISADRTRFVEPGDDEVGWTARRGRVPLGYLDDPDRTQATFPIVDGERLAIPGDRAQLQSDGNIRMLGRDAMVVNTGGEKVFVEEVEAVLREHPAVSDALVVGRPSERFGQEVVGVVSLRAGVDVDLVDLRDHVSLGLARFKAPRAILVCDAVRRHANGKADYTWAREVAADAIDVTMAAP
jgi:acyl-CoA synthetase (AMP-forming)/AMP-acid ligase II